MLVILDLFFFEKLNKTLARVFQCFLVLFFVVSSNLYGYNESLENPSENFSVSTNGTDSTKNKANNSNKKPVVNTTETKNIQFSRVLKHAERLKKKQPKKARKYAQEVFDSAKSGNSQEYQTRALVVLGQIAKVEKDYKDAQQYFQYAFRLSAQLDDTDLAIDALLNTSEVQRLMQRYEEAKNSVHRAQKLSIESSNQKLLIRCHITQGNIFRSEKEYESALASYTDALSLAQSYGDSQYLMSSHRNMARTYSALENFKLSIFHNQQALQIIESSPKPKSEDVAYQLEFIASDQRRLGDLIPALKNARRALVIQRKNKNIVSIEKLVLVLTIIHRKLGSYDYALRYGTEFLSIASERKDLEKILSANNQLALIYTQLKQYEEAENFYNRTLSQFSDENKLVNNTVDLRYQAAALRGLASIYTKQDKHKNALIFANQSLSIYKTLRSVSGSETVNRLIGQIYFRQNELGKSIDAFELALSQSSITGARWSESSNLIHLGQVLAKKNQLDKAKKMIRNGLVIAEDISAKSLTLMAYESLMNMNVANNNFKSAFNYLLQQHNLVQERSDDEVDQRIAELQILREMDLQERRIEILERQGRIDALELDRKNSELNFLAQENTIQTLKLEKEKTIRLFFIVVLLLSFLVLAIIFRRFIYPKMFKLE